MALLRTIEKNVRRVASNLETDCKTLMQALRCLDRVENKTDRIVEKIQELNERVSVLETRKLRRCGKRTHRNANSDRAGLGHGKTPQKRVCEHPSSGHEK